MLINQIKKFWEKKPLYLGEIEDIGTKEYFEKIQKIFVDDLFAGNIDKRIIPKKISNIKILDLGSGPGLYTRLFYENGCRDLYSADLTVTANNIVKKMCDIYNFSNVKIFNENAENLSFKDNYFDHVHCSGVIHHTEYPNNCYKEIARVLKPNGTTTIGVYYMNFILRNWTWLYSIVNLFSFLQPKLKGRERENIFKIKNVNEVIRTFDGLDNPKGIAYSKKDIINILKNDFIINDIYLHYFPKRTLKINLPNCLHKVLDKHFGFMIYINCSKK
jgi:ubiquinone/menaquinone biosynthesis C-methylase UbiE